MRKKERIAVLEREVADLKLAIALVQGLLNGKQDKAFVYPPAYPITNPTLPWIVTCMGAEQ